MISNTTNISSIIKFKVTYVTWRWIFCAMMIFSGLCTVISICVPETYAPVLLQNMVHNNRKKCLIIMLTHRSRRKDCERWIPNETRICMLSMKGKIGLGRRHAQDNIPTLQNASPGANLSAHNPLSLVGSSQS